MPLSDHELERRAARLRLLLLDVDGVLTDGTVAIDAAGGEAKAFYIRDGSAITWAQRSGVDVGLLSGRSSGATTRRARELGIEIVHQGLLPDKRAGYEAILKAHGYRDEEVAYMGDDLLDLPVLRRVALSAAPADAAPEVRAAVDWVSRAPGGRGAVREIVELILRARGVWASLVDSHERD